jgi:hypothetical protein
VVMESLKRNMVRKDLRRKHGKVWHMTVVS